jgi:60 kDa SS-A/Ro ribonucleoprotein
MYLRHQSAPTVAVPQSQPLNARQIRNDAGGFVFEVSDWDALMRFLVIGTEGGTFYVGQEQLTKRATELVKRCLAADGQRAITMASTVSQEGRALKQDYAIYVLALALAGDDVGTRKFAYASIPVICRTASTLFQLLSYLKGRRGWSRGLRSAVARWYDEMPIDKLGYQLVKYRERNGFTHRDAFRLAHPHGASSQDRAALYAWVAGKAHGICDLPPIINDFENAANGIGDKLDLVKRLPREALPTEWLNDPKVWESLLIGEGAGKGMPMTALLRNLGNLSKREVLTAGSPAAEYVAERFADRDGIRNARVHPIAVYLARAVYASGKSVKGSGSWAPVGKVVDALDNAFVLAFRNIVPTGKRILVAIDVSGSMDWGGIAGLPLKPVDVASAMGFVIARSEPHATLIGFDTVVYSEVKIAADESLRDFQARFSTPGGDTDCSLPFQYAQCKNLDVDAVVIFTDNQTWAGHNHPQQALELLRKHLGHRVKVVVAATTATNGSIGDTQDRDILQIAGFDASVPTLVSEWIK